MDTRISFLLLGCGVGFVMGYIVRSIRELKDKVDEVDKHVLNENGNVNPTEDSQDEGFVLPRFVGQIALLLVVLLTAWSAFASQKATNEVTKTQADQKRITTCNALFLRDTITALNQRTTYTIAQADANVVLQKSFADVINLLLRKTPPPTSQDLRHVIGSLQTSLQSFLSLSVKNKSTLVQNPYPTTRELLNCLNRK